MLATILKKEQDRGCVVTLLLAVLLIIAAFPKEKKNICCLNQMCKIYILELKRERERNLLLWLTINTCIFKLSTYMNVVRLNFATERTPHIL